jgi:hypothetical protein
MKIRLVGAELFHVDGRTDELAGRQIERRAQMTKLIDDFRNFAKVAKINFIKDKDSVSCVTKTQLSYSLIKSLVVAISVRNNLQISL